MAYRFFVNDAIPFEQSLRVAIGFGTKEDKTFFDQFSWPGSTPSPTSRDHPPGLVEG